VQGMAAASPAVHDVGHELTDDGEASALRGVFAEGRAATASKCAGQDIDLPTGLALGKKAATPALTYGAAAAFIISRANCWPRQACSCSTALMRSALGVRSKSIWPSFAQARMMSNR
jgi:hypothetical protein